MPGVHITPIVKDNGVKEYCMKNDTRVDGPWEFGVRRTMGGDRRSLNARELISMSEE